MLRLETGSSGNQHPLQVRKAATMPEGARASDVAGLTLRAGLAAVFLDFGIDKLRSPEAWLLFVPSWAVSRLSGDLDPQRVLQTQGLLEALLGAHLLVGLMTRPAAAVGTALLLAITLVVGWTPIGVRDAGLLAAALALTVLGPGSFSFDEAWARRRASSTFPAVAWGTVVALGLVVHLLHPGAPSPISAATDEPAVSGPFRPVPVAVDLDPRRVQLGQMLFHDARLSGAQTISCASCHAAEFAGADGRVVSLGMDGKLTERNSPTVFNAAHNFRQFWDGRARDLEEQIDAPLLDPHEMASSWDEVLARLTADGRYRRMFAAAYRDGVTAGNVRNAIAEFERSLVTPNAPFDRFLRGDETALAPEARRGYDTFRKLGCVACHHGINVGGNSFQTMGKMADYFADRDAGHQDLGRFLVTGDPADRHVFKVPGLRNVARTAPYFHDGSVATLPEAVRVMARYQLGYELAPSQVDDLVAFLESLTGDAPRM